MLAEELAVLAGSAATTLVAAMTTDAWEGVRSSVVRLFRHAGEVRQQAVEQQLSISAKLAEDSGFQDSEEHILRRLWQLELESLLANCPIAADELLTLVGDSGGPAPLTAPSALQANVATDGGILFAVQHGMLQVNRDGDAPAYLADRSAGG